jgi:hypothetical protein
MNLFLVKAPDAAAVGEIETDTHCAPLPDDVVQLIVFVPAGVKAAFESPARAEPVETSRAVHPVLAEGTLPLFATIDTCQQLSATVVTEAVIVAGVPVLPEFAASNPPSAPVYEIARPDSVPPEEVTTMFWADPVVGFWRVQTVIE